MDTTKVTRVEVVNHRSDGEGREYVNWHEDNVVTYDLQDGGKTLKVFIVDRDKLDKGYKLLGRSK